MGMAFKLLLRARGDQVGYMGLCVALTRGNIALCAPCCRNPGFTRGRSDRGGLLSAHRPGQQQPVCTVQTGLHEAGRTGGGCLARTDLGSSGPSAPGLHEAGRTGGGYLARIDLGSSRPSAPCRRVDTGQVARGKQSAYRRAPTWVAAGRLHRADGFTRGRLRAVRRALIGTHRPG